MQRCNAVADRRRVDPSLPAAKARLKQREELKPDGPEPPLDFPLRRGMVRAGVDEGDAQLGAGERELVGAECAAVVDKEAPATAAPQHRFLQDREEGSGVLGGA